MQPGDFHWRSQLRKRLEHVFQTCYNPFFSSGNIRGSFDRIDVDKYK
jgi:hypothetical protein